MQLLQFGEKLNCPIVVCLGYFGCMHKGHRHLVDVAMQRASECNAKVALFTFSNNHLAVLGKDTKVVYTLDERLDIYSSVSVDYVITATFNDEFRNLSGELFLQQLCKYNLKGAVCGFDFSCGRDRLYCNDVKRYLSSICSVDIVDAVLWNDEKISTTLVRKLLAQNDIMRVNQLLTEPYFLTGRVTHGRHVGSRLGFPTANLQVDSDKVLPRGVFSAQTTLNGVTYPVIVNIGSKPTFDLEQSNVEAHIIGFDGNLYGKTIKISLTKFLRDIRKFDSVDQLAEQLNKDKEVTLND